MPKSQKNSNATFRVIFKHFGAQVGKWDFLRVIFNHYLLNYPCRWKWEQNCVLFKKWSSNLLAKYANFHTHFQHLLFPTRRVRFAWNCCLHLCNLTNHTTQEFHCMFQGHLVETLGMTIGVIRYLLRLERTIARRRGTFSAYRPISLKAKHFGLSLREDQFSSCLEFLCSPRLI